MRIDASQTIDRPFLKKLKKNRIQATEPQALVLGETLCPQAEAVDIPVDMVMCYWSTFIGMSNKPDRSSIFSKRPTAPMRQARWQWPISKTTIARGPRRDGTIVLRNSCNTTSRRGLIGRHLQARAMAAGRHC